MSGYLRSVGLLALALASITSITACSEQNADVKQETVASTDIAATTTANSLVPQPVPSARELAPDMRQEKPVMREIPVLDAAFLADIDALEAEIKQTPTNVDNVAERVRRIQGYYDALQGHGVLLNYFTNSVVNRTLMFLASGMAIPPSQLYMLKVLDQHFFELRQIQQTIGKTGSLRRISPESNVLKAKAYHSVVLEYEVGEAGLDAGSRLRIGHNWYSDIGELQFSRPLDQGYTSVTPSKAGVEFVSGREHWFGQQFTSLFGAYTPSLTMKGGRLEPGDTIRFHIGDTKGGSPGWLTQSFTNDAMDLRFEVDFEGDGLWVPVAQPRFQVIGSEPDHLRVIAPSVVRPGEAVALRLNVEDQYFNEASSGPAELIAMLDGVEVARAKPVEGNPGKFLFPTFKAPSAPRQAPYYIDVVSVDDVYKGRSNPMMVRDESTPKLYWGELHGHEAYTDANGTPDWYMSYAKDVAFLDFASLTGHDAMLSEVHFRDILRATRQYHAPEQGFVTFPAYEWTGSWQIGGHHNVFYLDETQKVLSTIETGTLTNMLAAQRKYNDEDKVLVIPHAHQPGDWTKLDDKLGSLVEIYSAHGSFEWFGRKYLQQGYQVGFNAASDDHIGHPGNTPARAWSRGGLGAVFASKLDRQSIFKNLKARHTYGTSIARMFLETSVDGAPMGDVVNWSGTDPVELNVLVAGTAPIASIGVVVNGQDVQVQDYTVTDQNTGQLWFRMTSASEPNDPLRPRTPAEGNRYWGFVEIAGKKVAFADVQPIGIEPYGDVARQIAGNRVGFSWRVRGDYDGLLMDLDPGASTESVKVQIWRSDIEQADNWNIQHPGRLPGEYDRDLLAVPLGELLVDKTVPLKELLGKGVSGEIETGSIWRMSFVNKQLPTFRTFSMSLDKTSGLRSDAQNNVYVRVKQLDDHTAWGSPVFLNPE